MIVYLVIAVCLILNLINPGILWYMDSWKYENSQKGDPSRVYVWISRMLSAVGLVVLGMLYYTRM